MEKLSYKLVTVKEYILTEEQKHKRAHCLTMKIFNYKRKCVCGMCKGIEEGQ